MHISHQKNHKLMHKQIALNEKNIYFFRLPRLTFDLMKERVGNWEMEKILKGWWADGQTGSIRRIVTWIFQAWSMRKAFGFLHFASELNSQKTHT